MNEDLLKINLSDPESVRAALQMITEIGNLGARVNHATIISAAALALLVIADRDQPITINHLTRAVEVSYDLNPENSFLGELARALRGDIFSDMQGAQARSHLSLVRNDGEPSES